MWLVRINGSTKSQHGWCLKRKAASLLTPPSPSAAGAELAVQPALLLLCPQLVGTALSSSLREGTSQAGMVVRCDSGRWKQNC